jgi:hypothetical protein
VNGGVAGMGSKGSMWVVWRSSGRGAEVRAEVCCCQFCDIIVSPCHIVKPSGPYTRFPRPPHCHHCV